MIAEDDAEHSEPSRSGTDGGPDAAAPSEVFVTADVLRSTEAVVWAGDFNYRIDGTYEEVREAAVRNDYKTLLPWVRGRAPAGLACVGREKGS